MLSPSVAQPASRYDNTWLLVHLYKCCAQFASLSVIIIIISAEIVGAINSDGIEFLCGLGKHITQDTVPVHFINARAPSCVSAYQC